MLNGIGIDIIEIKRIRQAIKRYGNNFLTRVYSNGEISYCRKQHDFDYARLAVRFAAKEAYAKALGVGLMKKKTKLSS
ncbi:holo-[acyl-carrier-protein] synthase [Candidatus Saganbacteria bacterium CG08_land_8_20_14_0_20_45_16]|uniref:Holo-[acyl-carrier-protein] synthase n=1 Tax=Candidatus Saganbacteria bacterium CG08_land_8_20_14_0_20_45_16 TaxID=2014293 RepID=A0A2H0XXX7_UNCSA|nr:MAG: holo-[acyl-carrier-protein] synthase [Candidatus Saganbacteria bacterium CG08_land_8_20_14_0_20_45_16]